jgi:hypothetical protein
MGEYGGRGFYEDALRRAMAFGQGIRDTVIVQAHRRTCRTGASSLSSLPLSGVSHWPNPAARLRVRVQKGAVHTQQHGEAWRWIGASARAQGRHSAQ